MGYSNEQIQFILEHYMELASGNMPIDKAKEHLKSSSPRNPEEIFVIWKADIDRAISSLCPEHDHWHNVATEITPSMLLHVSRSKDLSRMQRDIVSLCIIRDCHAQNCERAIYCENQGIITRMRKFLNGKFKNKAKLLGRVTPPGDPNPLCPDLGSSPFVIATNQVYGKPGKGE